MPRITRLARTVSGVAMLSVAFAPAGLSSGELDSSFGTGGIVLTSIGPSRDQAFAVAVQPDGRIVAVGVTRSRLDVSNDWGLVRYRGDGSLDRTFGGSGKVTTDFGSDGDQAFAVALQPDGKIVAGGVAGIGPGGSGAWTLARYKSDGSLDPTFGVGGTVVTSFAPGQVSDDIVRAVAIQADGKIVAAGTAGGRDFGLARYNPDGTADAGFGVNGITRTDFDGGQDVAWAVAILPDGDIVAGGVAQRPGDPPIPDRGSLDPATDFALARYRPDGTPNPSFGSNGKVLTDFDLGADGVRAVAVQADGKVVAAGQTNHGDAGRSDVALTRYNDDGSFDTGFGVDGRVTTDFNEGFDDANGVALQRNGKIVVAGDATGSDSAFALARYAVDGALDPSFGGTGKVVTQVGIGAEAFALAIQRDGKIVTAGHSGSPSGRLDFALSRHEGDRPGVGPPVCSTRPVPPC